MKRAEKHMMCKKELRTVNIASPDQKEAIKQSELRAVCMSAETNIYQYGNPDTLFAALVVE